MSNSSSNASVLKNTLPDIVKPFTNMKEGAYQILSAPVVDWNTVLKLFGGVLIVLFIAFAIYFLTEITKSPKQFNLEQLEGERQAQLDKLYAKYLNKDQKSLYTTLIKQLDPLEQFLINLQPLTAVFGGCIGPTVDGVFSVDYYLQKALNMGIRSFVLPISTYVDPNKVPPIWPFSNRPAIVFRDKSGIITSRNGLTIKKFCDTLQLLLQSSNPTQSEEPILLHIVPVEGYVPDPVKEEKGYVTLMQDIAEELQSINSRRLVSLGQYGSAVGGARETEILTQTPLTDLKNKILVFTTFDVKIALKDAYSNKKGHLYEYANFIPQPVVGDAGTTSSQPNVLQGSNTGSGSKIIKLADIAGSKVNWMAQARTTFYGTYQDSPLEAPTASAVEGALKAGIQLIPIPFFYLDPTEDTSKILNLWGGFAWKVKEKDARFTKPAPIVPAPVNPKFNARVDNTLQPGQTKIV